MPYRSLLVPFLLLCTVCSLLNMVYSVHDMCQIEECDETPCVQPDPCGYYHCVSCFCTPACINTGILGK